MNSIKWARIRRKLDGMRIYKEIHFFQFITRNVSIIIIVLQQSKIAYTCGTVYRRGGVSSFRNCTRSTKKIFFDVRTFSSRVILIFFCTNKKRQRTTENRKRTRWTEQQKKKSFCVSVLGEHVLNQILCTFNVAKKEKVLKKYRVYKKNTV